MNPYDADIARVQNNLVYLNDALLYLNRAKSQTENVAAEAVILEEQVESGFHTNSRNATIRWRTDLENAIDDAILYVNAQIAAADGNLQGLLAASAAYEQQQSAQVAKAASIAPKPSSSVVAQTPPAVARNGATSTSAASKASGFAKYAKNGGR